MRRYFSILATIALLLVIGCGGGRQTSTSIHKPATEEVMETVPDWFLNVPQDPNFLIEVGTATSIDMQLSIDKAGDAAFANMVKSLENKFSVLSKRFQEEVGTGTEAQYLDQFTQATKAVASTVLSGVNTAKQELHNEGGVYRAYVMKKLPLGAAHEALMSKIKQQEQLYTRFRSTQVFEEMNKELEAYENWKAGQ